jgi:hypothetical protein
MLFCGVMAMSSEWNKEAGVLTITGRDDKVAIEGKEYSITQLADESGMSDFRKAVKTLVIRGDFDVSMANSKDWGIETLDLREANLGQNYAFKNFYQLSSILWPTQGTFVIPNQAFQTDADYATDRYSKLSKLTIPSNCTQVGSHAFDCHWITNLTIEGPTTNLVDQAFMNCKKLKTVTVSSGEENDKNGQPYCKRGTFDPDITYGQTDVSNIDKICTLNYPEGRASYFTHEDVDAVSQTILNEIYKNQSKNGWQEFVKNSTHIIINKSGAVFRTFSDTKEHTFAKWENDNSIMVFFVVGTHEERVKLYFANKDADYTVPANTGVLLYSKQGLFIYDKGKSTGLKAISQYAEKVPGTDEINYLESMQDAPEGNIWMSFTSKKNNQEYMNMFLSKGSHDGESTGWGFYSIIPKNYSKSELAYHAFLHIPTSIIPKEIVMGFKNMNGNDIDPSFEINSAKVLSLFDDVEEINHYTTGIKDLPAISPVSSDDAYYTLSGMKVKSPSVKGIYIHKGKKVYIK